MTETTTEGTAPQTEPGGCGQNPCRNGDHYGQCWGITAPYLETRETR